MPAIQRHHRRFAMPGTREQSGRTIRRGTISANGNTVFSPFAVAHLTHLTNFPHFPVILESTTNYEKSPAY
jgi:hypothetical protein